MPRRGFTVVELIVVVAVVGVLGTLAITSARQYMAYAKSAEAKQVVGSIGRAVFAAGIRLTTSEVEYAVKGDQNKGKGNGSGNNPGATVTEGVPGLCSDSVPVPDKIAKVKARKYQPKGAAGYDYQTGSDTVGWRCLRFELSHPHYYQYTYELRGPPISVTLPNGGSPNGASGSQNRAWTAYARGDLDGDGIHSWFVLAGSATNGDIRIATAIAEENPQE